MRARFCLIYFNPDLRVMKFFRVLSDDDSPNQSVVVDAGWMCQSKRVCFDMRNSVCFFVEHLLISTEKASSPSANQTLRVRFNMELGKARSRMFAFSTIRLILFCTSTSMLVS